jgi:hypothetical protein
MKTLRKKSKFQKKIQEYELKSKRFNYRRIQKLEEMKKDFEKELPNFIDILFENILKSDDDTENTKPN